MSTHYYHNIIIGIPLSTLDITTTEEVRDLYNQLGEKTGKQITLTRAFVGGIEIGNSAPNGRVSHNNGMQYNYYDLGEYLGDSDDWIWESGSGINAPPGGVCIGLELTKKGKSLDKYDLIRSVDVAGIATLKQKVRKVLQDKLGYTGDVYTMSVESYS